MLYESSTFKSVASKVKWGECDSKKLYDLATGVSDPDPPIVGNKVGLNLDVIFNNPVDVHGIKVDVNFTPQGG